MRNFLFNTKQRISTGFRRFKTWAISILIALGLVAGAAMATEKNFSWSNPTQNTDGSVFNPETDQAETRIYCGEDRLAFIPESPGRPQALSPTVVAPGTDQAATRDFMVGSYTCFATTFSVFGYESGPSNDVSFTITPTVAPSAINDFGVN